MSGGTDALRHTPAPVCAICGIPSMWQDDRGRRGLCRLHLGNWAVYSSDARTPEGERVVQPGKTWFSAFDAWAARVRAIRNTFPTAYDAVHSTLTVAKEISSGLQG